ncbi:MAG: RpiB/LacA/LacB family sugar-phosphate isomerase [Candidatus Chaera renei]|uniref:RpiB/LacA/LacB family sugar-phosphate isomerase n=1 Tax=Candidatus Chaera renei TaxID=2506947 RepID=A0A4Q0AGB1_9BACT|nr:MAG: RpiB/LacA/LacB family sugar-phosphate isomerase [Candidatus Chaera renei]
MATKIYLGSDHNGFHLKEKIFAYLQKRGYDVEDVGDKELDPDDDFPQFAYAAAVKILGSEHNDARAILLCGSGQGMCMAANRIHGIRAAVAWDAQEAKLSRNDNDSNVLCLPARLLQDQDHQWQNVVDTWLNTDFAAAARYIRRNRQLDELA